VRKYGIKSSLARTLLRLRIAFAFTALLPLIACAKPPIKIGIALPLTGVTAYRGVAARNAIELQAEAINASGGIRGRKLELIIRDDADQRDKTMTADRELMDLGVAAIVGNMSSDAAFPALALASEHRVPIVSPSISAQSFSGKDDYFFRTCGLAAPTGAVLGEWAAGQGLKKVAVALDVSNESYSRPLLEAFKSVFEGEGRMIETIVPFLKAPSGDNTALVDALGSSNPDGVFCITSEVQCAAICQALAKRGKKPQIIAPMGVMTPDLFQFGGKTVEGLVVSSYFDPESREPRYLEFKSRYEAAYGREPDLASCQGYDAMTGLVQAMLRARGLDGPGIREALRGLGSFEALQDLRRMDAFGDAIQSQTLLVAEEGKFVKLGKN
jgi:branched-chain amino acid transport system substrate-binding protein